MNTPEIVKCRDCVRKRHDVCIGFLDDGIGHPDSLPLCECDCKKQVIMAMMAIDVYPNKTKDTKASDLDGRERDRDE